MKNLNPSSNSTRKKQKKEPSIKRKIFVYLLLFCVLLLGILWLFQTVLLDSFYKTIKRGQVEKAAAEMAGYVQTASWEELENAVNYRGDIYAELWHESFGVQAVPGNAPEGLPKDMMPWEKAALAQKARENGGVYVAEETTPEPAHTPKPFMRQSPRSRIVCARLVEDPAGMEFMLIVSADITPVNATVETLRVQLICISILMLLLATALALIMAKRVSRPIEQLNSSARLLGQGDYSADFNAGGYREIAGLSATLAAAAKELSKTDALRRELVANVSHELRTPLTLITGYSEMMRDIPAENTAENMQVVIEETTRLTALVNDLLDLSQLEAGTSEIKPEVFELTEATESIITRVQKLGGPEGYDIHYQNSGHAMVCADEARIAQVIYNLIINAIAHGGQNKTVNVSQSTESGRVVVKIEDNGPGIPQDELDGIWERFYKAEGSRKRPGGGTGLGLSIVKSILAQHPGVQFGVESKVGEGSVFWFSLPLFQSDE